MNFDSTLSFVAQWSEAGQEAREAQWAGAVVPFSHLEQLSHS